MHSLIIPGNPSQMSQALCVSVDCIRHLIPALTVYLLDEVFKRLEELVFTVLFAGTVDGVNEFGDPIRQNLSGRTGNVPGKV